MIKKTEEGKKGRSVMKEVLSDVVVALLIAVAVLCVIRPTVVKQTSMENTLKDGDYLILYKLAYKIHGPERGDIIVFSSDAYNELNGDKRLLIKRVIGLPGDAISISEDDQLYINGKVYHEEYLKEGTTPIVDVPAPGRTYVVPKDCYFCMGDNRGGSVDSRSNDVGPVKKESIKGKIILRLFPLSKIGRLGGK